MPTDFSQREEIVQFIKRVTGRPRWECDMICRMCPSKFLQEMSEEEIADIIGKIRFSHKASTPLDDDEHWYATSPFTKEKYHYAAFAAGACWPTLINGTDYQGESLNPSYDE